ncbi:MAG TPA: lytic transglycosylase domain-containing protein [Acetobacteraceae bacterium]|nr:lytic transglycosylase domain-containing protein [Acetobacteraceae bacterium]
MALPQPLTPSDTALYSRIFADQRVGRIAKAKRLIPRLDDHLLMGQVLAQFYLGSYHHSTAAELAAWLAKYKNQPQSRAIYHLLLERLPPGAPRPAPPHISYVPEPRLGAAGAAPPPPPGPAVSDLLADQVRSLTYSNRTSRAIDLIAHDNHLSADQGAALRGEVARGLFTQGKYSQAYLIAAGAVRESHAQVWTPAYVAGLAAWQLGRIETARGYFKQAARVADASTGQRAAGAFWTARAALRLKQPEAYVQWLDRAAESRGSFYGMLARHLLGRNASGIGPRSVLSEADVEAVDSEPNGKLALALLEAGQTGQAARALRSLWPAIQADPGLGRAVVKVAMKAGLIDVAVALDQHLPPTGAFAGISLPMPALHPLGGFSVDPSLVYALARTESGFDSAATSAVGARGLMQLMPQTAAAMARLSGITAEVSNPAVNLALGQSYLKYLSRQPGVSHSLLDILASYNAGPVVAGGWFAKVNNHGDPLIFMESIPNGQTRRFVRQVLTDSWIYAGEIGMHPASLDALAEGKFPQLTEYRATALADR